MVRFLAVTVCNVTLSQIVLYIGNGLLGISGGWASVIAALVGMGPAYYLSRRWVWGKSGSHSFRTELAPFFGIAILGLVISAAFAEAADRTFGAGLLVNVGNLLGYFVVWVIKFLLLDRLFGPVESSEAKLVADETANASSR